MRVSLRVLLPFGIVGLGLLALAWMIASGHASALAVVPGSATTSQLSVTTHIPFIASGYLPTSGRLCRFGVGAGRDLADYDVNSLKLGWYIDWTTTLDTPMPGGTTYMPMVRLKQTGADTYGYSPSQATILQMVAAYPGATWLIGNEPDRRWYQDDLEPHVYAKAYHDLYALIKGADPGAQIAAGGIVQPTPLRLQYLDMVLQSYQDAYGEPMPVDVWNIHAFILRERSCEENKNNDCWGAEIPPGIDATEGMLYEIDDNGNIDIFKQNIEAFRRWMAERGYRERPLIITEFGIQMPAFYGFPPERVNAFMDATFDYLSTAVSDTVGYPADGGRLVQKWAWYSLTDSNFNGWLFDATTKQRTVFGDNFAAYTAQIVPLADLAPLNLSTEVMPALPGEPVTVTISAQIVNKGAIDTANAVSVRFYEGDPASGGLQIGADQLLPPLDGCAGLDMAQVIWQDVSPGSYPIFVVVDPEGAVAESDEGDNVYSTTVVLE